MCSVIKEVVVILVCFYPSVEAGYIDWDLTWDNPLPIDSAMAATHFPRNKLLVNNTLTNEVELADVAIFLRTDHTESNIAHELTHVILRYRGWKNEEQPATFMSKNLILIRTLSRYNGFSTHALYFTGEAKLDTTYLHKSF